MKRWPSNNQSGFALILLVVTLMAVGGLLLVGYSEAVLDQVKSSRFEHNKRVLEEAKLALLQYTYNYPQFKSEGPGRLPCPAPDANGLTGGLTLVLCESVGRLPWAESEMNFYDTRDADGEQLWYAVSNNFYNLGGGPVINSDSSGSITIIDQTGVTLYDGAVAGIAAVIIAPGPAIARDESVAGDGVYEYIQVRITEAQQNDPRNYLDTINGFDNSSFINGESDSNDDGFILGPVKENNPASPANKTVVVNDQMILITADEVINMAEKATLQAYQRAIDDYLGETGDVYPYLFNYLNNCFGEPPIGGETTEGDCTAAGGTWRGPSDIDKLTSLYPASLNFDDEIDSEFLGECFGGAETNRVNCVAAGNEWKAGYKGRIPSLFAEYYTEATGVGPGIESTFEITVTVGGGDFLGSIPYNQTVPVVASGTFEFDDENWNFSAAEVFTDYNGFADKSADGVVSDLHFEDLDPDVGPLDTTLTGTIKTTGATFSWGGLPSLPNYLYFWDGIAIGPTGKWRKCDTNAGHIDDCHVDAFGLPDRHKPGQSSIRLLRITAIELVFVPGETFEFKIDTSAINPVITAADGAGHATIAATFAASEINVDATTIRVSYEIDNNYLTGDQNPPNFQVDESGTMDIRGFADPAVTLTFRYYPILPGWAFNNGWHDSILMAYSPEYLPGEDQACDAGVDCLEVPNSGGPDDDKIAILINAGQHDWVDENGNGFSDDVIDVFEPENADLDDIFEWPSPPRGDNMLILSP